MQTHSEIILAVRASPLIPIPAPSVWNYRVPAEFQQYNKGRQSPSFLRHLAGTMRLSSEIAVEASRWPVFHIPVESLQDSGVPAKFQQCRDRVSGLNLAVTSRNIAAIFTCCISKQFYVCLACPGKAIRGSCNPSRFPRFLRYKEVRCQLRP